MSKLKCLEGNYFKEFEGIQGSLQTGFSPFILSCVPSGEFSLWYFLRKHEQMLTGSLCKSPDSSFNGHLDHVKWRIYTGSIQYKWGASGESLSWCLDWPWRGVLSVGKKKMRNWNICAMKFVSDFPLDWLISYRSLHSIDSIVACGHK